MKWSQDRTILKNNKKYLVWASNGTWVEYFVARYSDGTNEKEGFYEPVDWDYDDLIYDDLIKGWFDISLLEE